MKLKKAQEYAQTFNPIDIDEVSVIVRDFCAGYSEAEKHHAAEMQELRDRAVEAFKEVMFDVMLDCKGGKFIQEAYKLDYFTQKLTEK